MQIKSNGNKTLNMFGPSKNLDKICLPNSVFVKRGRTEKIKDIC